jgi:2,3-bisphosphoglycerate-dependent phosphoglycerate mutase
VADQLSALDFSIECAFPSDLARAREMTTVILHRLGGAAEVVADAALNERDYGELAGLNKSEAAARWAAGQIRRWRRGYADRPPGGESLQSTIARVLPFYLRAILASVMRERTTLVVAHGNSARMLIMALGNHTPQSIPDIELATGEMRL